MGGFRCTGFMLIGIDDTDSPRGMCTTYLGALLAQHLIQAGFRVREARLIRLNPNVIYKTRGNAAICIDAEGDPEEAFSIACRLTEELAEFSCENTNPGVVVCGTRPAPDFYYRALRDFCEIQEAADLLEEAGALYRGYKNGRGLIGAAAAVCSDLPDSTCEFLAYRRRENWGKPRQVDLDSIYGADEATYPHTWDSVDHENGVVVCVPHTPDPVLFGIRGENRYWVQKAGSVIRSEEPACEQVYVTNQGTDAHLLDGVISEVQEGRSYRIRGSVASAPATARGGHVSFRIADSTGSIRCMAYEPTKGFRDVIRALHPGDEVCATGSCKGGSINLEKLQVLALADAAIAKPPVCGNCGKRMTSAGSGKGYKCRGCHARASVPEIQEVTRSLGIGWYEVPPVARRHLAKPLCRGTAMMRGDE